jgi:hypothetical protein
MNESIAGAPTYDLDRERAIQGSGSVLQRIDKTGAYKGIFTKAKSIVADSGSLGIEFDFEAVNGSIAKFMKLWTFNKNYEIIHGQNKLNAIMTCMRVHKLKPINRMIKDYDLSQGKEIEIMAALYPDLMNQPIGLFLQLEEYITNAGNISFQMNIFSSFNAQTMQTASEMWNKQQPTEIEKFIETVKDKKLSPTIAQQTTQTPQTPQTPQTNYQSRQNKRYSGNSQTTKTEIDNSHNFQFDDDIPF